MSNLLEIVSAIFGVGGVFGFVSYFLFFKESKRLKKAEATEKELANLSSSIDLLKKQVEYQGSEIIRLQEQLSGKNQLIKQLYRERDILEKKYAQKKSAINCAIGCANKDECPVLIKTKEIEDEYYNNQIDKTKHNETDTKTHR